MSIDNSFRASVRLQALLDEEKFIEEEFYPGAPTEEIRVDCEDRVNSFIADLMKILRSSAEQPEILSLARNFLDSFGEEHTEERERVDEYVDQAMIAIGLDDWTEYL